jgi:hypothetical protein
MIRLLRVFGVLAFAAMAGAQTTDDAALSEAMAERNLEKRSDKALKVADSAVEQLTKAYREGDSAMVKEALELIGRSVELSYQSLNDSGKTPRKSKYFKRAEISTRKLYTRLGDISQQMSVFDREPVDKVKKRIQEVHEDLLERVMTKKKR